ncbi:MAG TPA: glutamate formimidoyltransferase [Candidatus Limnocylindrales bacterium]|nr:glutamate formimidoyltransferase [Candidatus Limnocylindrales bacterium]
MMPLVGCVPNFSDGRDPAILEAICEALQQHPIWILDVESDADHNRSVVTFAGAPEDVADAMLSAAAVAMQRISLEHHQGVHPRVGVVDVTPFVPLRDLSLVQCASLARSFAQRAAETLDVPVYLYEAAALHPERRALPVVRNLGYERLKAEIGHNLHFAPDFGPSRIGPAGAMMVGARSPLIAFNLYLDTSDVLKAQAIASKIRERDGGLPGVRALGLLVGGRAQVSCNLLDSQRTSMAALVTAVRREAHKLGAEVVDTELIGLAPQAALLAAAAELLGLPPAAAGATIEGRLGALTGDYRPL